MASSWIKMRTDLHDDPKVISIKRHVGARNAHSVTGALLHLWSLGDMYTTDGELKGYTGAYLDEMMGMPKFAEALALPEVDWLELRANSIVIKRFDKHNGASAKRRALAAERQEDHRNRNAPRVTKALPEKRREDKRSKNPPNPPCGGSGAPKGAQATSPAGFERWWSEFPKHDRKVGKSQACRIWIRKSLEPIAEKVIEALRRAKESPTWRKDNGDYVPKPTSWLNATPWETEPSELVRVPQGMNGPVEAKVYDSL